MHPATFILSTGRCGTQWISAALTDVYSDCITAEHEPLHSQYDSRKVLASSRLANRPPLSSPVVLAHMDKIDEQLVTRPYVECGHPNWSSIPFLADRFQGRVRVIHLTRHPVPSCCSWLTHGAFQPPVLPHMPPKILLSPFDEGIRFQEYQATWDQICPFEKCLFYWSEVHAFAIDLQSRLDVPWLRLRFEDLIDGDGPARMLDFLDLPHRERMFAHRRQVVDRHQHHSFALDNWQTIENHPRAMKIAQELGYDVKGIDETALRRRYLGSAAGA